MKKYYFLIFLTSFFFNNAIGQNNVPGFTCATANPACAGNGFSYPNVTGPVTAESGINYGCLGSQPRPTWFYFQVATSGPISLQMTQGTTVGQQNLDVDYICWGPFTAPTCGAIGLNGHIAQQVSGANACSFSPAPIENFTLNAVAGQYYMLMITNFNGGAGFITLSQTNNNATGAGSTNCDILCPLSISGGNTSTCANTSLTANYLNSVVNTTGPTTTFSWTYLCTGCTTPPVPVTGSAPTATTTPRGTKSNLNQPLPAGTYSVTATSPGCLNPVPATTVILPPVQAPINLPIVVEACTGATFNLLSNTSVVLAGLTGSYTIRYHNSEQEAIDADPFIGDTSLPPVASLTNYIGAEGERIWMSITDNVLGCITTTSFTLHFVSCAFTAGNTGPICEGGTFGLTADAGAGYTYIWTGPNGYTSTEQNPINIPQPTTPPFTYNCIATNGTITSNSSTTLFVKPKPVVVTTLIQPNLLTDVQTICTGGITDFGLSSLISGATFTWTVNTSDVSGATPASGNTIIQTLTNSTSNIGSATYTITPTADGCLGDSKDISITVNPAPIAIATPTPATICSGETTNIILTSLPAGATFEWTGTQTDITGVSPDSGFTIAQTLTATTLIGSANYAIVPTLAGCPGAITRIVQNVNPLTLISINPIPTQTICSGIPHANLSVTATGTGTLAYQWYSNSTSTTSGGTLIASATASSFIPPNTTVGAVYYYCIVTGTCGTATSTISEVILSPVMLITSSPIPTQAICNNSPSTTLSIAATGTGILAYQWFSNTTNATTGGILISSETAATFTPPNATAGTVYYYCVVTSSCGALTSSVSEVIVNALTAISTNPIVTQTICSITAPANLSVTATGTGTLTYQWYSNSTSTTSGGTLIAAATNITFTPPNTTVGTVYYYCIVTGTCGTATSTISEVIVTPLTVITVNPIPTQTICNNSPSTTLSIAATGTGTLAYQWFSNATNATTGGILISSATAATFTPPNATAGTVFYYCIATGTCGTATSTVSEVVVNPLTVITTNPIATQSICSGTAPANLSVTATGTGTLAYQWYSNSTSATSGGTLIAAATAASFTPPNTTVGTVYYYCIVTGTCGTATSTISEVIVTPLTIITVNPIPTQTICNNSPSTTLSIAATGTGTLAYQWFSNVANATSGGTLITSATAATFTPPNTTAGTVFYYCAVTSSCGVLTSSVSEVIVNALTVITTSSIATQSICIGTVPANLSVIATGTGTLTYQWYSNSTNATSGGTLITAATNISFTPPNTTVGTVYYYCIVTGTCGTAASNISEVIVTPLTVITVNPIPTQTICNNSPSTTLSIAATGTGTLAYQWFSNATNATTGGILISSETAATFTPPNATAGTVFYYCIATGTCGTATSTVSEVVVNPLTVITTNPIATQSICIGTASASLSVIATGTGTLTYQWYSNSTNATSGGTLIAAATNITFTPPNTTVETVYYYCIVTGTCGTATTSISEVIVTPLTIIATNPIVTQTICSGGIPLNLIVLATGTGTLTYQWFSNTTNATTGGILITAAPAATFYPPNSTVGTVFYYCVVTGTCGTVTSTVSEVIVTPLTVITLNPITTQTICNNSPATTLSVLATGTGVITYQWYSNTTNSFIGGTLITSATNTTFTPSNTTVGNVYYYCIATGTCGTATSTISEVIITPLTVIATNPIVTQTICNNSLATILSVAATGTGILTYQWFFNSTNATSGGTLITSATAATYTPPNTTVGTVYYYCVVTGTCGTATTSISEVIVTPLTVITLNPITTQTICNNSPSTTLSVLATGTGVITYQWYSNTTNSSIGGTLIISATNTTFTPSNTTVGTVYYYCIATGTCGTPTSTVSEVIVTPLTVIATNPIVTQTTCLAITTVDLSIVATGTGTLTYQWYSNVTNSVIGGSLINLETNTTFTPPNTSVGTVFYYCIATGTCGTATSTVSQVIINPIPVAIATPSTVTICSLDTTAIALTSNAIGTTYAWTTVQNNVSGATSGVASGSVAIIAQALTLTSPTPETVVYTITPSVSGCSGLPITATVTVNPLPTVAISGTSTICFGSNTSIDFAGTPDAIVTYTVNGGANQTVVLDSTGVKSISTGTLNTNTTYELVSISSSGIPICSNNVTGSILISVIPIPLVSTIVASPKVCSGQSTGISLSSNVANATFSWTAIFDNATGVNTGTGNIISDNVTATGTVIGSVTYSIIANFGSCSGPAKLETIIVNPIPVITLSTNVNNLCSGNTTSFGLSSNVIGTTFSWNVIQTNTSGASDGFGNSIAQTLVATSNNVGEAIYSITPIVNGCPGIPKLATVNVYPIPVASANVTANTICSGMTTNIVLSSTVPGTSFNWSVIQSGLFGPASGSGASISQTLSTIGIITGTVTYTITPEINGCFGNPITVTIIVNPTPEVFGSSTATICSGESPNITLFPSIAATTFSWTVATIGVIGAQSGTGNTIDTILEADSNPGTAVYTVTPNANNCSGTPINITVNVNPLPKPLIENGIICVDATTNIAFKTYLLDTKLDPSDFDFVWLFENTIINGEVGATLEADEAGNYSVLVTNTVTGCVSELTSAVVSASFPGTSVSSTQTLAFSDNATVVVTVIGGTAAFYYSMDEGALQLSNIFTDVAPGTHSILVTDINGCTNLPLGVNVVGYPTYFTPNGDGIHDTWNIVGLNSSDKVSIFDRYGKLIKQISAASNGWDGTFNGQMLTATDYWFTIEYVEPSTSENKIFKAHFSLKR